MVLSPRTHFRHSLHEQLLPLTQLLILALPTATITRELITTYDLMRLVLEPPQSPDGLEVEPGGEGVWLRPQSLNRMLRALLLHHFSLLKMLTSSLLESELVSEPCRGQKKIRPENPESAKSNLTLTNLGPSLSDI